MEGGDRRGCEAHGRRAGSAPGSYRYRSAVLTHLLNVLGTLSLGQPGAES